MSKYSCESSSYYWYIFMGQTLWVLRRATTFVTFSPNKYSTTTTHRSCCRRRRVYVWLSGLPDLFEKKKSIIIDTLKYEFRCLLEFIVNGGVYYVCCVFKQQLKGDRENKKNKQTTLIRFFGVSMECPRRRNAIK